MDRWTIRQKVDPKRAADVGMASGALMYSGDSGAHVWRIEVTDDGKPADLSGAVVNAYFWRADGGEPVLVAGEIAGNVCTVTLDDACYAYEGGLRAVVRLSTGSAVMTVAHGAFRVRDGRVDGVVDPGGTVPSLDALLGYIEALEAATEDARAVLEQMRRIAANGSELAEEWTLGTLYSSSGLAGDAVNRIRTGYMEMADVIAVVDDGVRASAYYYDAAKAYIAGSATGFTTGHIDVQGAAPADAAYYRVIAATDNDDDLTYRVDEIGSRVLLLENNADYVGDLIYAERDRNTLTPRVPGRYTGDVSTLTSIADMPDDSWRMMSGAQLQPLVGESFPWMLKEDVSFIVTKKRVNDTHVVYTVQRINGLDMYWGYEVPTRVGITWNTMVARQDVKYLEMVGRNLILNSAYEDVNLTKTGWAPRRNCTITISTTESYRGRKVLEVAGNSKEGDLITWLYGYKAGAGYFDGGEALTLSFAAKSSAPQAMKVRYGLSSVNTEWKTDGQWRRYEIRMPEAASTNNTDVIWVTDNPDAVLYLAEVKIELGNRASRWSPAPQDVGGDVVTYEHVPPHHDNVLITEFDWINGWWASDGSWSDTTHCHSQLIPVVAGKSYYLGYLNDTRACQGAFFDEYGRWLAPLLTENIGVHDYRSANAAGTNNDVVIYTFVAPEGARYLSYNLSWGAARMYRQYVSSSPVFAVANTGNYTWNDDFPAYQAKKDRRLCVIGASGVALDRAYKSELSQYVSGFQEYLVPWYASVDSYGYNGTPWGDYGTTGETPIVTQIAGINFGLYDEFILNVSTNGLEEDEYIGSWPDTEITTYCGAINAVLDKIYAESPKAVVYIANLIHKGSYYTGSKGRLDELNKQIAALADYHSLHLLDIAMDSGINLYNYAAGKMTSDGVHLNQEGNRAMGLAMRKRIIGF